MRFHLHYVAGRAEERLTFDLQPVVGARMGYTRHGRQDGVERFMRHYFLMVREVARAHRRAGAGPGPRRPRAAGDRRRDRCRVGRSRLRAGRWPASCFAPGHDSGNRPDPACFRILQVARDRGLELHPLALRMLIRTAPLAADLRGNKKAANLFLNLLCGGDEAAGHRADLRFRALAHSAERDRRARPLSAGLGAHRRPDAVRHLPCLHRRCAHGAGDQGAEQHRTRRA